MVEIAKNDSEYDVRRAAIRKISDESVLADVAKNDSAPNVRLEAVKKISDESVLADVAKNDSDRDVRRWAVNKIRDESVLIDIAKNTSDNDVREEAVKKINNQSVLIGIAKNDPAHNVRLAAVEKIDDESVLIDIAKNTSDNEVRETILKYYKPKYIDKIIDGSNFYNNSLKEFEKKNYKTFSIYDLENHDVLMCHPYKPIFTNWNNIYYENSYLSGSSIKSKPVKDHEFNSIRYISEDFSNKKHIKKRKYEYTSERISIENIQDPATDYWVNKITTRSKFSNLEAIVIIGITDKITDLSEMFYGSQVETISFANCDFSNVKNTRNIFAGCNNLKTVHADKNSILSLITFVPESKLYIIEKIKDNEILYDIALKDSDIDIIITSVEKITDMSLLEDIALNHECNHARIVATKKLNDKSILEKISVNDSDKQVRKIAKKRLDELSALSKTKEEIFDECVDELLMMYRDNPDGFYTDSSSAESVRHIGKKLSDAGGFDLMLEAHKIVTMQGVDGRNLEACWDGIGGWVG